MSVGQLLFWIGVVVAVVLLLVVLPVLTGMRLRRMSRPVDRAER